MSLEDKVAAMSVVDDKAALESLVLSTLQQGDISDTFTFAESHNIDHQAVIGAVKSLLVDGYVAEEPLSSSYWTLTAEGEQIAKFGSPEYQALHFSLPLLFFFSCAAPPI